MNTVQSFVIYT